MLSATSTLCGCSSIGTFVSAPFSDVDPAGGISTTLAPSIEHEAQAENFHESLSGKGAAHVNVRYNSDAFVPLMYTQAKASIRADVAGFAE